MSNTTASLEALQQATAWLWTVMYPLLLLLGTFGSVMTMVVMRRLTAGHSTPCMPVYFTALALSDLLVLVFDVAQQFCKYVFHVKIRLLNVGVCKCIFFADYVLTETSTWFLVAMTCQRVTSVLWPLKARLHSGKRALIVVSDFPIMAAVLHSWQLYKVSIISYGADEKDCSVIHNETDAVIFANLFVWQDLIQTSVLPFCILSVCNVLLIWEIRQSVKRARTITGRGETASRQKKTSSLTVTVVMTSVTFLVLTLPYPAYNLYTRNLYKPLMSDIGTGDFPRKKDQYFEFAITELLLLVWYINPAVNFYLYCLTGTKFRREAKEALLSVVRCCKCRPETVP